MYKLGATSSFLYRLDFRLQPQAFQLFVAEDMRSYPAYDVKKRSLNNGLVLNFEPFVPK